MEKRRLGHAGSRSRRSASGAWACRPSTARPTRPSRSRRSSARSSSGSTSSTRPRCTGRSRTRSWSARRSRATATTYVIATKFGVRPERDRVRRVDPRRRRLARERAALGRGLAEAPRHRPHRPLLPAPHGPEGADRGDGRGAGELVAEGKVLHIGLSEAAPETDPQGARDAPDHRGADRVLALDPRPRGGDPADAARARDRPGRVLAARPRLPLRALQVAGGARRRRLPPHGPRFTGRQPRGEPRARGEGRGAGRGEGDHRRRSWRSPGSWRRATTWCRSPGPSGALPGAERGGGRGRAHRRRPGADRRRAPARRPATATTRDGMAAVNI